MLHPHEVERIKRIKERTGDITANNLDIQWLIALVECLNDQVSQNRCPTNRQS